MGKHKVNGVKCAHLLFTQEDMTGRYGSRSATSPCRESS